MIERERWGEIAVLRLSRGKVNALDVELLQALGEAFVGLEQEDARAVVLTGAGSAFSAGVDLFRVLDGGAEYVDRFLPLLSQVLFRVFTFPRPVIVAMNGHAIAGGCVLACAGDLRLMADGKGRVGVPELRVGVPFPTVALELVRFGANHQSLAEIIYGGGTFAPEEARRRGLVDEVVPADDLLERARVAAESYAAIPAGAFALAKRELRQPTVDRIARFEREMDAQVRAMWRSPASAAAIRSYLDKTIGKR